MATALRFDHSTVTLISIVFTLTLANSFIHSCAAQFPSGQSVYEISARPWLYALSQKYGRNISRLSDVPTEELKNISAQGFDYLWLMGVWHLGPYGLNYDRTNAGLLQHYKEVLPDYTSADIIGSPYAVTNYTLNPELGSIDDLVAFRKKLQSLGLKLMLDFVPNHTAVDCPWTSNNPNYYVRAPNGSTPDPNTYLPNGIAYGSAYPGGAWMDTAQLNYWNPDTQAARLQELLTVASYSDAVRCDMAYLLLNDLIEQNWGSQLEAWDWTRPSSEWWTAAITTVKSKYPNYIFLGEVYSPYQSNLQSLGFDYTYDKQLLDKLGGGDIGDISSWITSNSLYFTTHSAHYLSNHDEERAAQYFGSWYRADAAALIAFTLPGLRFYWMWQFEGYTSQLDIHLRREESQASVADVQKFYATLLPILNADVFKKGNWSWLSVENDNGQLIAYSWEYQDDKRLCVLNFNGNNAGGVIVVPNAQARNGNDTIPVTDLLTGTVYYRSASAMRTTGLNVLINEWYGQLFEY